VCVCDPRMSIPQKTVIGSGTKDINIIIMHRGGFMAARLGQASKTSTGMLLYEYVIYLWVVVQ
jgi:hypothetical protein